MDLGRLFEALVKTAERAGVVVRIEPFDPTLSDVRRPRGGLCTLRGERLIVVDANLPLPERVATLAEALSSVDLEAFYIAPVVREAIQARRPRISPARRAGRPRLALVRSKT